VAEQERRVVVGYDGSRHGREALEWAVDEAQRRGAALCVVHALGGGVFGPPMQAAGLEGKRRLRRAGEEVAAEGRARALERAPGLEVSTRVHVQAPSTAALVDESAAAELVVVGTRGHGGFAGMLLGSTSTAVAMHAHCPVVIARHGRPDGEHGRRHGAAPGPSEGRVVVGVDGSPRSAGAVEPAFAAASSRGVGLTAVLAWSAPWAPGAEGLGPAPDPWADLEQREAAVLDRVLAGPSRAHPDVDVRCAVVRGHAGEALVEHSRGAELVVVGSRGRGGLRGLLLGSVSRVVVHHAECPVLVVRGEGGRGASA
jgi:nucleotide-binding universal stress UspA family protein